VFADPGGGDEAVWIDDRVRGERRKGRVRGRDERRGSYGTRWWRWDDLFGWESDVLY
jgi:hypothetical protein